MCMVLQGGYIPAEAQTDKGQEIPKEGQIDISVRLGLYLELPIERPQANGNRYYQIG